MFSEAKSSLNSRLCTSIPYFLPVVIILAFLLMPAVANAQEARCGDANGDGAINVGDVVYMVRSIFINDRPEIPLDISDVNCDGRFNVGDVVYLVLSIFRNGPAPCYYCDADEQLVYFDVYYMNSAWGYVLKGHYIDRYGYVYSYDHSFDTWISPRIRLTEDELMEKIKYNRRLVGIVDFPTLREKVAMIPAAAEGPMSDYVNMCADFGIHAYDAYVFYPETREYLTVTLYQSGDWAWKNFSEEAIELHRWLKTLTGEWDDSTCGFPGE